ncbi:MAG: CRISPR-associated endonuclease Cas2 [Anaerolineae bacterium]
MHCLVVYDIPDDAVRTKVADVCLDYGLERIQYSAFEGILSRNHQQELLLKIKKRLGRKEGNVQVFPICQEDWKNRLVFIQKGKEKGKDEG